MFRVRCGKKSLRRQKGRHRRGPFKLYLKGRGLGFRVLRANQRGIENSSHKLVLFPADALVKVTGAYDIEFQNLGLYWVDKGDA